MNGVGTVCVGFLMIMGSGQAAAQTAKPAGPQVARPPATAPARAATTQARRPQTQRAASGGQAVSRAIFLNSMDAEFRKMDADKNGTVTRAEVEGFERAVSVLKAQRANRALFARLDSDRNGQLSAAEFSRLASAPQVDVKPILARMDLNRDQSISLVEHRTATLANFDRMDTDKNGIVTPAEIKAAGAGR